MARKGITYDQVANASAAITARGQEPTLSAIRGELGNEGSFSTISQHLAKWKQLQAEVVDVRALPEVVENAALTAITTIWNVASKQARAEIAGIEEAHNSQVKTLTKENEEVLAFNKHLEETIEREVERGEKDRKALAEAEKKLTAANSELETLRRVYSELLATFKQPSVQANKAADTKKARSSTPKPAPEKTPADDQQK